jgi:hypothetical protein
MSCVRLLGIEGNRLHVGQHDLLDGTPVLDVKPYLPYADAFPEAGAGWVDAAEEQVFSLELAVEAAVQIEWVGVHGGWDLLNFLKVQLRTDPTDAKRKRIVAMDDGFRIAFRTWRVDYRIDQAQGSIEAFAIASGYSTADLAEGAADKYQDKAIHREFIAQFYNEV